MLKIKTFLMFEGKAEAAMNLYIAAFPQSTITAITRYGADAPGHEGTVQKAEFVLNGQEFMCIDSPGKHGFSFTPSISLFVNIDSEAQVDHIFEKLSVGGQVMMPLGAYPFSKKFCWFADQFGVSWQLSFTEDMV